MWTGWSSSVKTSTLYQNQPFSHWDPVNNRVTEPSLPSESPHIQPISTNGHQSCLWFWFSVQTAPLFVEFSSRGKQKEQCPRLEVTSWGVTMIQDAGSPLLPNAIRQDTPRSRGAEERGGGDGWNERRGGKRSSAATGAHPPILANDVRTVLRSLINTNRARGAREGFFSILVNCRSSLWQPEKQKYYLQCRC